MRDEEFKRLRLDYLSWEQELHGRGQRPDLPIEDRERWRGLLEAALRRFEAGDGGMGVRSLAAELFKSGVPASDEAVMALVESRAAAAHRFLSFPLAEFVDWLELQVGHGDLSIKLLTCLRKHFPMMDGVARDMKHRAVMRRLAVALKLQGDEVIPEIRDSWTAVALSAREALSPAEMGKWDELLKLANEQHSSKPAKKYLVQAAEIVAGFPSFSRIMAAILEVIGRDGPVGVRFRGFQTPRKDLLDEDFTDLLRALIWLSASYPELTVLLREVGERCSMKIKGIGPLCAKIAAACAEVLSRQESPAATQALAGLTKAAKHKTTRKGVAKAVRALEARSGVGWAELEDKTVPDFGFSTGANPELQAGRWSVTLGISKKGMPEFLWSDGITQATKKPPAALQKEHPGHLVAMKVLLRDVKKTWKAQIDRLEKMMCRGRRISAATWKKDYLGHPIVGLLSRRLLWQVAGQLVAFPHQDGELGQSEPVTIKGDAMAIPDDAEVILWHPAELAPDQSGAWEKWVLRCRLLQPFQQALREVHRPDIGFGSMEDTRYAGELLHQGVFAALCRERGWTYSFHGDASQFEPWVQIPGSDLRGVLKVTEEVAPSNATGELKVWLRIVHVRFLAGNDSMPLDLNSVPPVAFSEVMRDIGLFAAASRTVKDSGWRHGIPPGER